MISAILLSFMSNYQSKIYNLRTTLVIFQFLYIQLIRVSHSNLQKPKKNHFSGQLSVVHTKRDIFVCNDIPIEDEVNELFGTFKKKLKTTHKLVTQQLLSI